MDTNTRTLITYGSSKEKEAALDRYKRTDSAVLFAPSMDRGVDLPDDLCRVQVIAKIPYPNLADKRIKARLYTPGGQAWYTMHTVRTIVQMAGRAVRHREDYAITYMFDKQFEKIWGSNSKMFPRYFRDAVNFRFNPRLVTET
jgi:Rad3-related DNA helicase